MRFIKSTLLTLLIGLNLICFFHCSSSKNPTEISFEKTSPIPIEKPYFQSWIAGVQGGGSGINLYLPVQNKELKLDSAYFRGMIAEVRTINLGYVSYFKTTLNQNSDIIMSNEVNAEYGNQLPENKCDFPFILKENECVISFTDGNKIKYFKIENLIEMPLQQYPSAPPKH